MKKPNRLLISIVILLLLISNLKAEVAIVSPPKQCFHVNCWTYPFSGTTVCELEIEACDGRAGELEVR